MSKRAEALPLTKQRGRRQRKGYLLAQRTAAGLRRRAGHRIAQPSALLAAIIESSDDAIYSKGLEGKITSWNRGAELLYGYRTDEIIGKPNALLVPTELLQQEAAITELLRHDERVQHYETIRITKSKARVQVSLTVSPIKDRRGAVVGVSKIARDISNRKEFEEGATRLRLVFEAAPNGMVIINEQGVITMVNSQMERLFGYQRAEMLDHPVEMLLPERYRSAHSDQRCQFFLSPETRAMGHVRDLFARRKDGTEFPVEVGLNPADTPEGKVVLASLIDITQRKAMEQELASAHSQLQNHARNLEAVVAERTADLRATLAELEAFSYSLSHDMRAPLRTIQSFSQIVLEEVGEKLGPAHSGLLSKVITAASRLDRLIQDVLTYSRVLRSSLELTSVDVEKLLRQIIDERPEFQPPKAQIEIQSPIPAVRGHEAYLTQCVTNLLDNAVKFISPGRQPRVRIRCEPTDGQVRLWFEDNGIGIPKEAQKRLFGLFQRVHGERTYAGTGIGLAIVRKAVERMQGRVGFESEPGQGSRFWLQLRPAD